MFDEGLHPLGAQKRPPLHRQLRLACEGFPKAHALAQALIADPVYVSSMEASNSLVVNRMGYSDHGMTHALITATNAMAIFGAGQQLGWSRALSSAGANKTDVSDSAVILLLASLLHDCGNGISREKHYEHGVMVAQPMLEQLLGGVYRPEKRQKIMLAMLECIYSHDNAVRSYSLEGSILKLADAMDCEGGRSRLPPGDKNPDKRYHLSAQAIDFVHFGPIVRGKPLPIWFELNDKVGLFQLEEIMAKRMETGALGDGVVAEAFIDGKKIWKYPK